MQSTNIRFYNTVEPGTSFIGIQLCFIHPGQGKVSTSILTAFVDGMVSIRMKQAVDPVNVKDKLKITANMICDIATVPIIDLKCKYQLEYTSSRVFNGTPVLWNMPRQSCFVYMIFEVVVVDKITITWIWDVTTTDQNSQ